MGKQFALYSGEAYSGPCEESKDEAFSVANYIRKELYFVCFSRF